MNEAGGMAATAPRGRAVCVSAQRDERVMRYRWVHGSRRDRSLNALDASLDAARFFPVTTHGRPSSRQQRSQVRLRGQVALDLQNQPLEFGAIGSGHISSVYLIGPVCAVPDRTLWSYRDDRQTGRISVCNREQSAKRTCPYSGPV